MTATTAAVEPLSFTGPCPISYTLVGTITVDGPGTVTYRWGHSPGTGILESVTFAAGDPLTKTVTRAEKCGPTEGPCDFRELVTYSPNQLIGFVDLSGLHCANALERLKPERLIPKKSIGPPPVELHPTPVLPAVRKPLPPPPFRLKNGQQGVVQDGKFYLVGGDGKRSLAPDGTTRPRTGN